MKRKSLFSLLLPVCCSILIFGCKKKESDNYHYGDRLGQYYQVNFFKADTSVTVNAWFTDARTGQQLLFPDRSIVTANGKMDSGIYSYSPSTFNWNFKGVSNVDFRLNKSGKILANSVSRSSIGDVTIVADSVFRATDTMKLAYTGEPLVEGEFVSLAINRDYDSTSLWSGLSMQLFSQQVVLDFYQTRNFYPGKYTLVITRQKQVELQQNDAGGYMTVTVNDVRHIVVK